MFPAPSITPSPASCFRSTARTTGLADFGTRLKATFNNVPAGVRVFVSTANVNSNDSPVTAPNPIGGSQANTAASGAYTGYAVLVNNESTIDGNAAGGAFPAVIATDSGPGSTGIVPIAEVAISNGTGSAVWEVVNTNPNTHRNLQIRGLHHLHCQPCPEFPRRYHGESQLRSFVHYELRRRLRHPAAAFRSAIRFRASGL